jgi:hypothetical protein
MLVEKRREKKKNVINTCNKYNKYNPERILKSFSMRIDDLDLFVKFYEVARREAGKRGFSTTLVQAMREYVMRHGRGNTAMRLINYCDPSTQSPFTHLCNFSKGARNDGHIFCSNPSIVKSHDAFVLHGIQGNWLNGVTCYSCAYNKLRKK